MYTVTAAPPGTHQATDTGHVADHNAIRAWMAEVGQHIPNAAGDVGAATPASVTAAVAGGVVTAQQITPAGKSANYTLALADAGDCIDMSSASALTVTIPANATVAFPTGTTIEVAQIGAGQVTIVAASGVTIQSPGALVKTRVQYSAVVLRKRATDTWHLAGDLA